MRGLDLTAVPASSGSGSLLAVVGGTANVGFSNTLSLAVAHSKGIAIVSVAPGGLYDTTAPIRTARDLIGRTIAVAGLHDLLSLGGRHGWAKAASRRIRFAFSRCRRVRCSPRCSRGGSMRWSSTSRSTSRRSRPAREFSPSPTTRSRSRFPPALTASLIQPVIDAAAKFREIPAAFRAQEMIFA